MTSLWLVKQEIHVNTTQSFYKDVLKRNTALVADKRLIYVDTSEKAANLVINNELFINKTKFSRFVDENTKSLYINCIISVDMCMANMSDVTLIDELSHRYLFYKYGTEKDLIDFFTNCLIKKKYTKIFSVQLISAQEITVN